MPPPHVEERSDILYCEEEPSATLEKAIARLNVNFVRVPTPQALSEELARRETPHYLEAVVVPEERRAGRYLSAVNDHFTERRRSPVPTVLLQKPRGEGKRHKIPYAQQRLRGNVHVWPERTLEERLQEVLDPSIHDEHRLLHVHDGSGVGNWAQDILTSWGYTVTDVEVPDGHDLQDPDHPLFAALEERTYERALSSGTSVHNEAAPLLHSLKLETVHLAPKSRYEEEDLIHLSSLEHDPLRDDAPAAMLAEYFVNWERVKELPPRPTIFAHSTSASRMRARRILGQLPGQFETSNTAIELRALLNQHRYTEERPVHTLFVGHDLIERAYRSRTPSMPIKDFANLFEFARDHGVENNVLVTDHEDYRDFRGVLRNLFETGLIDYAIGDPQLFTPHRVVHAATREALREEMLRKHPDSPTRGFDVNGRRSTAKTTVVNAVVSSHREQQFTKAVSYREVEAGAEPRRTDQREHAEHHDVPPEEFDSIDDWLYTYEKPETRKAIRRFDPERDKDPVSSGHVPEKGYLVLKTNRSEAGLAAFRNQFPRAPEILMLNYDDEHIQQLHEDRSGRTVTVEEVREEHERLWETRGDAYPVVISLRAPSYRRLQQLFTAKRLIYEWERETRLAENERFGENSDELITVTHPRRDEQQHVPRWEHRREDDEEAVEGLVHTARAVVLNSRHEFLLIKNHPHEAWTTPAGHSKPYQPNPPFPAIPEYVGHTLVREVFEELGRPTKVFVPSEHERFLREEFKTSRGELTEGSSFFFRDSYPCVAREEFDKHGLTYWAVARPLGPPRTFEKERGSTRGLPGRFEQAYLLQLNGAFFDEFMKSGEVLRYNWVDHTRVLDQDLKPHVRSLLEEEWNRLSPVGGTEVDEDRLSDIQVRMRSDTPQPVHEQLPELGSAYEIWLKKQEDYDPEQPGSRTPPKRLEDEETPRGRYRHYFGYCSYLLRTEIQEQRDRARHKHRYERRSGR